MTPETSEALETLESTISADVSSEDKETSSGMPWWAVVLIAIVAFGGGAAGMVILKQIKK